MNSRVLLINVDIAYVCVCVYVCCMAEVVSGVLHVCVCVYCSSVNKTETEDTQQK